MLPLVRSTGDVSPPGRSRRSDSHVAALVLFALAVATAANTSRVNTPGLITRCRMKSCNACFMRNYLRCKGLNCAATVLFRNLNAGVRPCITVAYAAMFAPVVALLMCDLNADVIASVFSDMVVLCALVKVLRSHSMYNRTSASLAVVRWAGQVIRSRS